MKKMLTLVMMILLVVLACGQTEQSKNQTSDTADKAFKVGITQFVTHPSLDQVKDGFKKAFEEAGL